VAKLRAIFSGLAFLSIIINLDGGAVPAALLHIERTFELSTAEVGVLGMLVYEGIAIGSLFVGPLLSCFSAVRATQLTLFLNTGATLAFGASRSTAMLLVFRVSIGLLQAIPAVYFPIWVDEFAPAESATVWMAVIQAGAPLGIMSGYVFSGVVTASSADPEARCLPDNWTCGWRWPFYLQSVVLIFFSFASLLVPKALYDLGTDGHATCTSTTEPAESFTVSSLEHADVHTDVSSIRTRSTSTGDWRRPTRGESIGERVSLYLAEALTPIGARVPILHVADSTYSSGVSNRTEGADRAHRMEARIRRMSSTPVFVDSGAQASEAGASEAMGVPERVSSENGAANTNRSQLR
jgi:hypothetical protein